MRRRSLKLPFIIAGLALVICVSISLWFRIAAYYDDIGIVEAAAHIGATPTLANIQKYIEGTLHNGISRQEVEETLQHIAPIVVMELGKLKKTTPYGIGLHFCDRILLKIGPYYAQFRISACYDPDAKLLSWGFDDLE